MGFYSRKNRPSTWGSIQGNITSQLDLISLITSSAGVPYSGATTDVDLGTFNFTTTGAGTFGSLMVNGLATFNDPSIPGTNMLFYDGSGPAGNFNWNVGLNEFNFYVSDPLNISSVATTITSYSGPLTLIGGSEIDFWLYGTPRVKMTGGGETSWGDGQTTAFISGEGIYGAPATAGGFSNIATGFNVLLGTPSWALNAYGSSNFGGSTSGVTVMNGDGVKGPPNTAQWITNSNGVDMFLGTNYPAGGPYAIYVTSGKTALDNRAIVTDGAGTMTFAGDINLRGTNYYNNVNIGQGNVGSCLINSRSVVVGNQIGMYGSVAVAVGYGAAVYGDYGVSLGIGAVSGNFSTALGNQASANYIGSTAIGVAATATQNNEMIFATYNGSSVITQLDIKNGIADFIGNIIKPVQHATTGAPSYVKGAIYFDTTLNKLRVGGATAWETVTSL